MSYFKHFETIPFDFGDDEILPVTNILNRYKIRDDLFNDQSKFFDHEVTDGETPEIIADKLYGDPELAWIVLMVNNIFNVYEEFPMDYQTLERFVIAKYGAANKNNIHHYTNTEGVTVNTDHPSYDRIPITNLEHEIILNDEKRKIRLLLSVYVEQIKRDLRKSNK